MAYQHAALNVDEVEMDGNEELTAFYQRALPQLISIPVRDIDPTVIKDIALMLHATEEDSYSWQKYVTNMGITKPSSLMKIKVFSYYRREPPLILAMCENLSRSSNFGQIINALLKTEQFNVLRLIQPYVKGLLDSNDGRKKASSSTRESLGYDSLGRTPLINSKVPWQPNCMPNSLFASKSDDQLADSSTIQSSFGDSRRFERQTFQQRSLKTHSKNAYLYERSSDSFRSPSGETLPEIKPLPSAPAAERVTVLIMHTEFDRRDAVQLSDALEATGFIVICLFNLDSYISTNSSDALDTFFQEVDFVVPVVSTEFLQQIYPKNHESYLESRYAQYNSYLFQLIRNEYINNRCRNYRVKPVIVPGMSRQSLIKENILSSSFRLPDETDTLIRVLQDTKELNLQNMNQ